MIRKEATIIDTAVPGDTRIVDKEQDKILKYQDLKRELKTGIFQNPLFRCRCFLTTYSMLADPKQGFYRSFSVFSHEVITKYS